MSENEMNGEIRTEEKEVRQEINTNVETPKAEEPKTEDVKEEAPAKVEAMVIQVNDEPAAEKPEKEAPHPNYHEMDKEQLVSSMKEILENLRLTAHKEVSLIKQALFNIRQKETEEELNKFVEAGNDPEAFSATPCELEVQFKEMYGDFKEKRAAYLEAEENRKQENLAKKLGVIENIKALMEDVDNINRNYPRFVELQAEFKAIKDIPAAAENDIWKQYKLQEEHFYDLLKLNRELRDLDFKKNLEIKRQLVEQAKALATEEDVIEAGRKLQILHNEWRETGPVAKEIREEIWNEFKEASSVVNKRHQEYFDSRREKELENEAAKTKLCEEAEAIKIDEIKSFTAWDKATEEIKALQSQWREIGPAPRKVNNTLFARFRAVCDKFFETKAEYYKTIKNEHRDNLAKKEALCVKAEELMNKVDEPGTREKVQALQAEWKTIGPVERKQSDAIWARFTAACNAFYEQLRSRRSGKREEENANLEAKKAVIEKIKAIPLDGERSQILPTIRELQMEWQQIGYVPFKVKEEIYKEYRQACDAVYNSLDSTRTRERMNDYQERIRSLRGDRAKEMTEKEKLLNALDRKKNDLATYENNMGFFNVKSSAGNAMVQELERKINKIKEEISEIKEKLTLLEKGGEEKTDE